MTSSGKFRLKANGPYDFESSSAFYRRSRFESDARFGENMFVRAFQYDDAPILIMIDCDENRGENAVRVNWFSPEAKIYKPGLRRLLTRIFYLDFQILEFYGRVADPVMKSLVKKYPGFRPIMAPSVFEAAAWSIIGQQVNLAFAFSLKMRLIKKTNLKFVIDNRQYFLFPGPEEVARLNYDVLRSMQFSRRKAEYLIGFARRVADGKIDLEGLKNLDYEEAVKNLMAIRGIGPWSANYILLRGAGHGDAFPVGDSGLNRAIRRLYGLKGAPKQEFLIGLSKRWRPYRSLATYYLWKSLQEVK